MKYIYFSVFYSRGIFYSTDLSRYMRVDQTYIFIIKISALIVKGLDYAVSYVGNFYYSF